MASNLCSARQILVPIFEDTLEYSLQGSRLACVISSEPVTLLAIFEAIFWAGFFPFEAILGGRPPALEASFGGRASKWQVEAPSFLQNIACDI